MRGVDALRDVASHADALDVREDLEVVGSTLDAGVVDVELHRRGGFDEEDAVVVGDLEHLLLAHRRFEQDAAVRGGLASRADGDHAGFEAHGVATLVDENDRVARLLRGLAQTDDDIGVESERGVVLHDTAHEGQSRDPGDHRPVHSHEVGLAREVVVQLNAEPVQSGAKLADDLCVELHDEQSVVVLGEQSSGNHRRSLGIEDPKAEVQLRVDFVLCRPCSTTVTADGANRLVGGLRRTDNGRRSGNVVCVLPLRGQNCG